MLRDTSSKIITCFIKSDHKFLGELREIEKLLVQKICAYGTGIDLLNSRTYFSYQPTNCPNVIRKCEA